MAPSLEMLDWTRLAEQRLREERWRTSACVRSAVSREDRPRFVESLSSRIIWTTGSGSVFSTLSSIQPGPPHR